MFDGGIKHDVGLLCQKRVGVAHNGNELIAEVFDKRYKNLYFRCIASLRKADDYIARLYHTEVAMDSVGSVHEEGRRAGAVEGGDDFGGNVSTFANTGNYDPSRGRKNGFDGVRKAIINAFFEVGDSFFFIGNNLYCNALNI